MSHAGQRAHRRRRARRTRRGSRSSSRSWPALIEEGHDISVRDVKTATQLLADDRQRRSARALPQGRAVPTGRQAPHHREVGQPAPLSRRHRGARHRVRHRPGRHGQDLSGHGAGGELPAGQEGEPHHPGAPGGRSRREARVSARRPAGEGQPVPASALRRALRHDGAREGGAAARARHDRSGADCLHARAHAERRVRDPRRGAEHDQPSR